MATLVVVDLHMVDDDCATDDRAKANNANGGRGEYSCFKKIRRKRVEVMDRKPNGRTEYLDCDPIQHTQLDTV
jgi:hypothetical protein